jgi:rfaE bifunctional protein kinase chain/domain
VKVQELFESFSTKKIMVIGDVMIDRYMQGNVSRISPEAPVPIVNLSSQEDRLGGAANVALNLVALGAETFVASVVGKDKEGDLIVDLFKNQGIECFSVVKSSERISTVKTRVLGNNQQLVRIDTEQTNDINADEENELIDLVAQLIQKESIDAIVFEDYNKGVLTEKVIQSVIKIANEHKIFTTVDPKKNNFLAYQQVSLFKPNLKELKEGVGVQFDIRKDFQKFEEAVDLLTQRIKNQITFVTLSELGVFIQDSHQKIQLPAHIRNIADVSGAGDTVISVATLCLASGIGLKNIAQIANISGGLVCEEVGVVSIDKMKLKNEIIKIIGEDIE